MTDDLETSSVQRAGPHDQKSCLGAVAPRQLIFFGLELLESALLFVKIFRSRDYT